MQNTQRVILFIHVDMGERAPNATDGIERFALKWFAELKISKCLADQLACPAEVPTRVVHQPQWAKGQCCGNSRAVRFDRNDIEPAATEIGDQTIGLWNTCDRPLG